MSKMLSRQMRGLAQSARMRLASSRQFSSTSSSSRKAYEQAADQSNSNVAYYGATLAVVVFGVSYASVPLYKVFCQVTGFGGTTRRVDETTATTIKPVDGGKVRPA